MKCKKLVCITPGIFFGDQSFNMIFAKVFFNLQIFSLLGAFSKSDTSTEASQKGSLIPRSLLKFSLKVADLKGKYNFKQKREVPCSFMSSNTF